MTTDSFIKWLGNVVKVSGSKAFALAVRDDQIDLHPCASVRWGGGTSSGIRCERGAARKSIPPAKSRAAVPQASGREDLR